ncbi:hypothetical protein AB6A23_10975 [Paenibacillus tarimensis]
MIAIHRIHRELANIAHMNSDAEDNVIFGIPELKLIMPLLIENMKLVRRLDELKNLAYVAHISNDFGWEQDICREIDELEAACL